MKFYLCSRQWNGRTWYAGSLPGDGGVDWGYADKAKDALPLSTYWMRRFVANARACGDKIAPGVFEVANPEQKAA
jgi:hypothetical protein